MVCSFYISSPGCAHLTSVERNVLQNQRMAAVSRPRQSDPTEFGILVCAQERYHQASLSLGKTGDRRWWDQRDPPTIACLSLDTDRGQCASGVGLDHHRGADRGLESQVDWVPPEKSWLPCDNSAVRQSDDRGGESIIWFGQTLPSG